MFRAILSSILFAALALGQASITITDTLKKGFQNTTWSGTIQVTSPATVLGGISYKRSVSNYTVSNGVVNITLAGGGTYRVTYIPADGSREWSVTWVVPSSGGPYAVKDIEVFTPIEQSPYLALLRLGNVGASGTYIRSNGTNWVSSTIPAADVPNLDAAKITTGTFGAARLPATIAYTGQSNSFGSGFKQTFAASATTAGINVSAAGLPSSPALGDIAIDSGDANKFKWYNGSAWVGSSGGGEKYVASLSAVSGPQAITHNLNSDDVAVTIYDNTGQQVLAPVAYTSVNALNVTFDVTFTGKVVVMKVGG